MEHIDCLEAGILNLTTHGNQPDAAVVKNGPSQWSHLKLKQYILFKLNFYIT